MEIFKVSDLITSQNTLTDYALQMLHRMHNVDNKSKEYKLTTCYQHISISRLDNDIWQVYIESRIQKLVEANAECYRSIIQQNKTIGDLKFFLFVSLLILAILITSPACKF